MQLQKTVARKVSFSGISLHRGDLVKVTIYPAPANSGIRFVRTDLASRPVIPARHSRVVDTSLATTLGVPGATVATVEHLLAAMAGLGIDNARIEIHGAELPIMDGSAAPFTALLRQVGVTTLRWPRAFFRIQEKVEVAEGDSSIAVEPAAEPSFSYTINFSHPFIGEQKLTFKHNRENFCQEIAPARTFGFLKDVEMLHANGLALGGSLDNALVLDASQVMNPGGLRFPDEFVRHKILDLMGDMALLGWPLLGHLKVKKGSHKLHNKFLEALIHQQEAWRLWIPEMKPYTTPTWGTGLAPRVRVALA